MYKKKNFRYVDSMEEVGTSLVVKYNNGEVETFDAVKLAIEWLYETNDKFFENHNFNYVPSDYIKDIVKSMGIKKGI